MINNPRHNIDVLQQPLIWVDCEFTGLDIDKGHKVIEIGAIVTKLTLEPIAEYQTFVNYGWDYVTSHMDINPWWTDRNDDRERMRVGLQNAKAPDEVDRDLAGLVLEHFGVSKPPLCGNSVGNDKKHIDDQFKLFAQSLHYQIIDVSSLKLLAMKYLGVEYDMKAHKHHALEDIKESIDELRFLLKKLGIIDLSQIAMKPTPSMRRPLSEQ